MGTGRDHCSEDIDTSYSYPLALPRLVEAPNYDSSTVVQCTGQDRSPTGPRTLVNPPYTQHRGGDDMNKDEPVGLDGNAIKDEPAGLDGNGNKDGGAGQDNKVKGEGAGRSRGVKR